MEHKPTSDESAAPRQRTVAERRMRLEQALASTRIEGHQPSAEFLADMQAMVTGQLGAEEVRRRIIERAREADRRATAGLNRGLGAQP
ncbi:antitoxin VbhA family protein [Mitsuaria sp. WAJ17]|uniref:antitoxin VbhA family protein n=1 Tax=Mitsuaria sp. WAJ17 TaxID=2761452 RepID=UPI0016041BAC|nr:antitoxin VbhA family protein [Mitsuaria sp. WAJ17]MBB2486263.1 antitoxin VbhA family protein [Mitsuaria sp. WAJ17]